MKKLAKYFLFLIVLGGVFVVGYYWKGDKTSTVLSPISPVATSVPSIKITKKEIKEDNFTGNMPIITGKGKLADAGRTYVDTTIKDFRTEANRDVPPMKKQFGADSPTASYEIDIDAKYIKSDKTESIVMVVYTYTGGAHGNSLYKVLTATLGKDAKILSLSEVINTSDQTAFTDLIKKELLAWRPSSTDASPVFPDDVNALKFNSFVDWSLDDKNLTLYFDQYEIGPGVLGGVAFPISLDKIKNFLNTYYSPL